MLSNAGTLTLGQVVSTAAIFVRNWVIVRSMATKDDYGVATTFVLALTVVTTLGNLSVESLLVQAPDGDGVRFQRTGQFLRFGQGLALSILLFFAAPFIAVLFHLEELAPSYRILALAPLVNALVHFDTKRYLRVGRFGPEVLTECGSQVFALVLVCCLAPFLHDYRLVICGLLAQFTGLTLLTHLVAERRYGWATDRNYVKRLLSFGWPLLLSGFCMMAASQGERIIIGASESLRRFAEWWQGDGTAAFPYTKADLADYAIALGLAQIPTLFFAKVVPTMWFPLLSARQGDIEGFRRLYSVMAGLSAVFASTLVAVFSVAGEGVLVILYGKAYAGAGVLMAVLMVGQSFRVMRYVPITGAMAHARTRTALVGHIVRALAVLLSLFAAVQGIGLIWIATCAVAGESLALALAAGLFHRHPAYSLRLLARPVAFLFGWIGIAVLVRISSAGLGTGWELAIAVGLAAAVCGSALLVFPILLGGVREALAAKRAKRA